MKNAINSTVLVFIIVIACIGFLPANVVKASMPASTDVPNYNLTVGSFTGGQTFSEPQGIATDASGNMFVIDRNGNRIVKLDSSGNYVTEWYYEISCGGSPPSVFGIAVDKTSGNVYVVDHCTYYTDAVWVYSNSGTLLTKWATSGYGNADGEIGIPSGIAVDSNGYVYISDPVNARIQKFDSSGNFITKWGSSGSANGQFSNPQGIAIDSSNNIYVADRGNKRIQKFDSSGSYITKWGSSGSGNSQFNNVNGLAIDASNNVYASDVGSFGPTGNHRIQKFDSSGAYITKWGAYGSADGQFYYPVGVAIGSSGNILVSDYDNNRIQSFDSTGAFLSKVTSLGELNGKQRYPYDVATDSDGNVYTVDYWLNRIQKFDSSGNFVTKWGNSGSGDGQFSYPQGLATDSSNEVYVADSQNSRIQKFDSSGNFITKWGSSGSGDGQFSGPQGVAVDSSGNVYVADTNNNRIQKFDSSGNFITKWGSTGSGDGQFHSPVRMATDSSNEVYVADSQNSRIQKFDSSGNFITKWGTNGAGNGQFSSPYGAVVAGDVIYVSDGNSNGRIEKFDLDGNFLATWGSQYYGGPNNSNDQFGTPSGLAIDSHGNLYVADPGSARVQKFSYPATTSYTFSNAPYAGSPADVTLTVPNSTDITCANSVSASSLSTQDPNYTYPLGVTNFCFSVSTGSTNQVSLTFVTDLKPSQVTPRKYNSTTHTYSTLPSYTLTETTVSVHHALQLTYSITDGGSLDQDGVANGAIVDPVGLAIANASNSTLASTGEDTSSIYLFAGALIMVGGIIVVSRVYKKNRFIRAK